LEKVPLLHKKFEYRQVKDQILPRMLQLLLTGSNVKVKVQVLMGLSRIFEIFDKSTITDVILTAFEKLTKTDRTPAVCMCLLGCYDAMSKHLGHKVTAERILPLMIPLLAEESLSSEQWETQFNIAKKLLQRVEAARRKEYAVKGEQQAEAKDSLGLTDAGSTSITAGKTEAAPLDFESLLMGTGNTGQAPVAPAPAPAPKAIAPPPPGSAAPPAAAIDLLGGGAPAPPAPSGGFDPFASMSTPSVGLGAGGFDPFKNAAPAPAPTPAVASNLSNLLAPVSGPPAGGVGMLGGMPGMQFPAATPTPGLGNAAGYPGGMPGGMPGMPGLPGGGGVMPGMQGGAPGMPGMTGMQGMMGMTGPPATDPNLMRNMNYDPFAEISSRG
jgi:SCY1-like protein 2